jgi:hypothetical protein
VRVDGRGRGCPRARSAPQGRAPDARATAIAALVGRPTTAPRGWSSPPRASPPRAPSRPRGRRAARCSPSVPAPRSGRARSTRRTPRRTAGRARARRRAVPLVLCGPGGKRWRRRPRRDATRPAPTASPLARGEGAARARRPPDARRRLRHVAAAPPGPSSDLRDPPIRGGPPTTRPSCARASPACVPREGVPDRHPCMETLDRGGRKGRAKVRLAAVPAAGPGSR